MIIDDILKYANDYDLFIFDINGVLDNNHDAKIKMLKANFPDMTPNQIATVIVDMERYYEEKKSGTTASHVSQALKESGITVDESTAEQLAEHYYNANRIKPEIIQFLNNLSESVKVCFYTSLSKARYEFITSLHPISSNILVFAREDQIESKPSIRNLQKILEVTDTKPENAILFGDNVAVDIMAPNFLGIKSVLVTNYVDDVIKL